MNYNAEKSSSGYIGIVHKINLNFKVSNYSLMFRSWHKSCPNPLQPIFQYFNEKIAPGLSCPVSPYKFGGPGSYISSMAAGNVSYGPGFSLSLRYPELPQTPVTSRTVMWGGENLSLSEPAAARRLLVREAVSKSNKKLAKKTGKVVSDLKKQADTAKSSVENQNKKIAELDKRIDQQNEVIEQQNARLAEQEEKLAEMNRRLMENEQIIGDLAQSTQEKTR